MCKKICSSWSLREGDRECIISVLNGCDLCDVLGRLYSLKDSPYKVVLTLATSLKFGAPQDYYDFRLANHKFEELYNHSHVQ